MVNICESLINVVSSNKPKMLIGLNQNGKWPGIDARTSSVADDEPPAERQDLTHTGTPTERGKPVSLPLGKQAVRCADGEAGMGWWRTRMPSCNGADRGSDFASL